MIEKDVVVIGAGVAGLSLSKMLEKSNIDFVTLEKNYSIGKYGNRIINKEIFRKLDMETDDIIRPIKKMKFYSPSEIKISKESAIERGYVINLRDVEKRIYSQIEDKKNIALNHAVNGIDLKESIVSANGMEVKTKIIIISSGCVNNFESIKNSKRVLCYTKEIPSEDDITVILNNEIAHGFYGWVIPLSNGNIEIGFGSDRLGKDISKASLSEMLYKLPYLHKYKDIRPLRELGGFIPTSIITPMSGENWIKIGDVSGGEPMMGGSIHKCFDEAKLSFDLIKRMLNGEIRSLDIYDNIWGNKIGSDIKKQESIRNLIDSSKNTEIDRVFLSLVDKEIEGEGLINNIFKNIITNLQKIKARPM